MGLQSYLQKSASVLLDAASHPGLRRCDDAIEAIASSLSAGKPLLVCGNGGSASDAQHITGEFIGRFLREGKPLNCVCLSSNPAVLTAWSNDYSFDTVFSRQVEAYGVNGGVLLGISTSGNSKNVVSAFETARRMRLTTIGLTGEGGGKLARTSDILLDVPSTSTPLIQQVHICVYHYICQLVEERLRK